MLVLCRKKALPGYNDLASQHPDLLKEWDYTKNTLAPTDCTSGSSKKVWWICSDGHEWEAAISSRAKGSGCPYCSGLKVIHGVNDLVTLAPDLLNGWDYQRNKAPSPDSVSPHSHKVVWWKCSAGHTWQEIIRKRFLSKKRNCPICKK
jgi:hypothetical protein